MTDKKKITARNIGKVPHIEIELPKFGFATISGRNGSGKSNLLSAVGKYVSEEKVRGRDVPIRDGIDEATIDGLGVKMIVRRDGLVKKTGTRLSVTAFESRFDPSKIVVTGLKETTAAERVKSDAHRIKMIARLLKIKPAIAAFAGLLPKKEMLEDALTIGTTEADDVLELAKNVKRDLEAKARECSDAASQKAGEANTLKEMADKYDEDMLDEDELTTLHVDTVRKLTECETAMRLHDERSKLAGVARTKLEGMDIDGMKESLAEHRNQLAEHRKDNEEIEKEIIKLKERLDGNNRMIEMLDESETQLAEKIEMHGTLSETVASFENMPSPTPEEFEQLKADAKEAADGLVASRQNDECLKSKEKYEDAIVDRDRMTSLATQYRVAAQNTFGILNKLIATENLWVNDDNLLVTKTGRGETPYRELSIGERTTLIYELALSKIKPTDGKQVLLIMPQELHDQLDDINRLHIHNWCAQRCDDNGFGPVILTGKSSIDDIHCEIPSANESIGKEIHSS